MNNDEETRPQIVWNGIMTPDGTILESHHRHDYQTHTDANGCTYMVDGGCEYLRRNLPQGDKKATEMSLYLDSPFRDIRERTTWGTRCGDDYRYIRLKDLGDDHIQAILDTQDQMADWMRELLEKEQEFREIANMTTEEALEEMTRLAQENGEYDV